ncbi:hypothetical protein D3C87_1757910 [compost metagenome]
MLTKIYKSLLTLAWVDLCLPIYPAKVIVPPTLVRSISGEIIQSLSPAKPVAFPVGTRLVE